MSNGISDNFNIHTDRQAYNIVSLGFFCSVASECERIGVRTTSLPFDWLITGSFEKVLSIIENHFARFLIKDNLKQEVDVNPKYYYDAENRIHFYHDFKSIRPFDEEYDGVKEKYDRRIRRFYDVISKPTVFIRYVNTEQDIRFIENNYEYITDLLKSFNSNNVIYFIANKDIAVNEESPNFFLVDTDKNDTVAKRFLKDLPDLRRDLIQKSKLTKKQIRHNKRRVKKKNVKKFFKKIFLKFKLKKV